VAEGDDRTARWRQRATTVFGWVAGGSSGLLANYALFLAWGPEWPIVPTTFALFVGGCFAGMFAADRLGARAFRVLGVAAGILLALAATLVVAVLMTQA
jgi:hypothetical protein